MQPHPPRDVADEIGAIVADWYPAIARRDRGWFERRFADDLRVRNVPLVQERGKAAMIELELSLPPVASRTLELVAFAYRDVALSHWSALAWRIGDDEASAQQGLFSATWRWAEERWQVFGLVRAATLTRDARAG